MQYIHDQCNRFEIACIFKASERFGEVSSSSGYLEWATLFYCGTP